jgi:hypothetical protein
MIDKTHIIFSIIAAIVVTIINIVEGVDLLQGSLRIIIAICIAFTLSVISKMYIKKNVFIEEVNEETEQLDIEEVDDEQLEGEETNIEADNKEEVHEENMQVDKEQDLIDSK